MCHQMNQNSRETVQPIRSLPKFSLSLRHKQIQRVCQAIVSEFRPEKIILFGSFANGKPTADSDIDLLLVMPFEGSPFRQASVVLSHVIKSVGVLPMDLLVRTAEQIGDRVQIGDRFISEIIKRGKVLYEKDYA